MKYEKLLSKLRPTLEHGSPIEECMDGTRQNILGIISNWLANADAPNILWLKGHPGLGKSAIAASVIEQLRESKRLGSSFFFKREQAGAMTTNALWRTIACDLARRYPSIRQHLVAVLEVDEDIPSITNMDKLFQQLIRGPLLKNGNMQVGRSPVIVIDALDECGGIEGQSSPHRKSVIRTLKSWSELPRLIVAGGPNSIRLALTSTHCSS